MLWSPQKSLASHFMAWLGRRLIVAPETIQAPKDFYYEPGDRDMPSRAEMLRPEVQRERIRVDAIRRALFERVGLLSTIFAFAICVTSILTSGAIGGVSRAIGGPVELSPRQQMRCANLSSIPEERRLPAQRAEFKQNCN
jgi:hypothetical protein